SRPLPPIPYQPPHLPASALEAERVSGLAAELVTVMLPPASFLPLRRSAQQTGRSNISRRRAGTSPCKPLGIARRPSSRRRGTEASDRAPSRLPEGSTASRRIRRSPRSEG